MKSSSRLLAAFIAAACSVFFLSAASAAAATLESLRLWSDDDDAKAEHSEWAAFLVAYTDDTNPDGVIRVKYAAALDGRASLDRYIDAMSRMDPRKLGRFEAFAYWTNVYNALTVQVVLENYPVKSIRNIKPNPLSIGPWKKKVFTVVGVGLSLDDIEHAILRPAFKDPRVHYAVNCASIGCPNLTPQPFSADGLDAALDRAARAYVNHPRGARFDDRGRLIVSSIYRWFSEDFGGSDAGIIAHLSEYAEPDLLSQLRAATKIHKHEYDWSLNDAE